MKKSLLVHTIVLSLFFTIVVAQEEVETNSFHKEFLQGNWQEALKNAPDDFNRHMVYWRIGDIKALKESLERHSENKSLFGDTIRVKHIEGGPLEALKEAELLASKQNLNQNAYFLVESLAAALEAGHKEKTIYYHDKIKSLEKLDARSLEKLIWILPKVSYLLEQPEIARRAAVDMADQGIQRYPWNPRFKVLKVLYYYHIGQRIDARDWAEELGTEGAFDPFFQMAPSEAQLNYQKKSTEFNIDVMLFEIEKNIRGIETFTGTTRLNKVSEGIDKLSSIAPGLPQVIAARAALKFAHSGEEVEPEKLQEVTVRSGKYWYYLSHIVADAFDRRRAIPYGQRALEKEPWNVEYLIAHGINCHREGRPKEALESLSKAHKLEPRISHVWNLKTLIASVLKDFSYHKSDGFDIRMRADEWKPFKTLFLPAVEEEFHLLEKRYKSRPDTIHFILYSDKQDFDVSVFMVPSAPAIGACMGRLVTMPAPSYLQYKKEPWAPVLRHEMAHAFHVHLSGGRVTRWFTEGLAHYEEFVKNKTWDWEEKYDRKLIDLIANNKLAAFGALDSGFQGPDVRFYYQYCRWIMEWLDEEHGWDSILKCLKAYKNGVPDNELFQEVMDLSNAEAETQFRNWLNKNIIESIPYVARVPGPLASLEAYEFAFSSGQFMDIIKATERTSDEELLLYRARSFDVLGESEKAFEIMTQIEDDFVDDFTFNYIYGRMLAEEEQYEKSEGYLIKARKIYPNHIDYSDNPHYWLYQIYSKTQQIDKAFNSVWQYTRIQQKEHRARFWLIRQCIKTNKWDKMKILIKEVSEIHPYHFELILWQADQAQREGNAAEEINCYERLFAIATLEDLVDQETLWSDQERLNFLKKAVRPWLNLLKGEEQKKAAETIEFFFPNHPEVKRVLVDS